MEEQLGDETLVVRGGLMDLLPMRDSIRVGIVEEGFPNLSFWGDNGLETLDDVVRVAPIVNARVRTSTIGRLRSLGYEPERSEPWPHLTVRFNQEPTDTDLEALRAVFEEPVPNPRPAD